MKTYSLHHEHSQNDPSGIVIGYSLKLKEISTWDYLWAKALDRIDRICHALWKQKIKLWIVSPDGNEVRFAKTRTIAEIPLHRWQFETLNDALNKKEVG